MNWKRTCWKKKREEMGKFNRSGKVCGYNEKGVS
jgi:hypothetical protein